MNKGITDSAMSILIWMIIGVVVLVLIVLAGYFFYFKIPLAVGVK